MPKLSNKTLDKMFICPNCGRPFRTRQGLSGHKQFKHKVQKSSTLDNPIDTFLDIRQKMKTMETVGIPQPDVKSIALAHAHWPLIQSMCDILKISTNNQDYKHYIITSLARRYENEALKNELLVEFNKQLGEIGEAILKGFGLLLENESKILISLNELKKT